MNPGPDRIHFSAPGVCLVGLALALSALQSGCSLIPGRSPAINLEGEISSTASITVANAKPASDAATRGNSKRKTDPIQDHEFKADASATLPAGGDRAQRAIAARAEARRKALRALGAQIVAWRLEGGSTVREFLARNPDAAEALGSILESQSEVQFQENAGTVTASASIPGKAVAGALKIRAQPEPAAAGPGEKLSPEQEAARDIALEAARKLLQAAILDEPYKNGKTLKGVVDPKKLGQTVGQLPAQEVEFTKDGLCRVTVALERKRLPGLVR